MRQSYLIKSPFRLDGNTRSSGTITFTDEQADIEEELLDLGAIELEGADALRADIEGTEESFDFSAEVSFAHALLTTAGVEASIESDGETTDLPLSERISILLVDRDRARSELDTARTDLAGARAEITKLREDLQARPPVQAEQPAAKPLNQQSKVELVETAKREGVTYPAGAKADQIEAAIVAKRAEPKS